MEKLYDRDSHLRFFTATVLSCEEKGNLHAVSLNRTAFYPEGGGQPADTGVLGGFRVTDVQERQGTIFHFLDGSLEPGTEVDGAIDWDARFSRMQQHSGEHIVSGIIGHLFGFDNVGFHLGSDVVTVDFNGVLSDTDLERIENLANAAIYENLAVDSFTPGPQELAGLSYRSKMTLEGDVRIVRIPGYDACACCGTHVARTGEIGLIKLLSGRRHKGGTRMEMLCGKRAFLDYAARHQDMSEMSVLLSSKPPDVPAAVRRLMAENESLKKELSAVREKRLLERVSWAFTSWLAAGGSGPGWVLSEDGMEPSELRRFILLLSERISERNADGEQTPEWMVALSGTANGGCLYACARIAIRGASMKAVDSSIVEPVMDLRHLAKTLNASCKGRGGGSADLVQGSLETDRVQVEKFLEAYVRGS